MTFTHFLDENIANDGINMNDAFVTHTNFGALRDVGTLGAIPMVQVPYTVSRESVKKPKKFNALNFKM